jgi:guanylate kinase
MNERSLFIISGPSGAGEDSIIDALSKRLPLERVITTTTRKPRQGEIPGKSYYFISSDTFNTMVASDSFAEWAEEYNGNFYGVTHEELGRVSTSDSIGIWKIEWKGVLSAKRLFPGIIAMLISAPLESIHDRLLKRGDLSEEQIRERAAYTVEWMNHTDIYDYIIENRDGELEKAVNQAEIIIKEHAGLS